MPNYLDAIGPNDLSGSAEGKGNYCGADVRMWEGTDVPIFLGQKSQICKEHVGADILSKGKLSPNGEKG